MKRSIFIFLALFLLAACGGRNAAPVATGEKLQSPVKIYLDSKIPYYDPIVIASNIKTECSSLGNQLSDYVKKYSNEYNIEVIQVEEPKNIKEGFVLDLHIRNALSAGNAWSGHKKQVLISAELLKDGEKVDVFTASRDSMGGFWGGFKGSCSVLDRTVNTLGSDTAVWLSKKL